LFQSKNVNKVKTNLLVFIHPKIMRDQKTMLNLVNQKYDHIRTKQQEVRDRGVVLLPDEESPLLPKFEEYLSLPPPFEETPYAEPTPTSQTGGPGGTEQ
jgi:general secretion pathway protein D